PRSGEGRSVLIVGHGSFDVTMSAAANTIPDGRPSPKRGGDGGGVLRRPSPLRGGDGGEVLRHRRTPPPSPPRFGEGRSALLVGHGSFDVTMSAAANTIPDGRPSPKRGGDGGVVLRRRSGEGRSVLIVGHGSFDMTTSAPANKIP